MQGTSDSPGRPFLVALVGIGQSLTVDGKCGVQPVLVHPDSSQVFGHDLASGHPAALHRGAEFCNAGLDDGEAGAAATGSRGVSSFARQDQTNGNLANDQQADGRLPSFHRRAY